MAERPARPRVLLADDHSILRERLRALLEQGEGFEVVAAADERKADLVLLDLALPNMSGLEAIREIKRRSPQTKALVLTSQRSEEAIRAALQAGADGYVLKDASRAELVMAIDTVLGGKPFISPSALQTLVGKYRANGGRAPRSASLEALTARERQVLKLIAEGERNRQIAEQLGISVKTVEKHRSNLMQKLKLHNTAGLTSFAIENRLVSALRGR